MTEEEIRPIAENYVEEFCHCSDGEYTDGSLVCAGIGTALIVSRQLEKQIEIDAIQIRALQKQNGELTDKVRELEEKLEQTENDLADYQFNYPTIKELEAQIEKMKCYLPVDERDSNHKWFAYKNIFDTEWKIDYSVQGELPKCNTIKWFENKEAVMFYLVSNGMKYYEEPRR